MLHILWMLLKIIGMILLIILGLLVLSICIVLFVPLKYLGKAESFGTVDSIKAQLKFSWLFHLISGYVYFENKETKWQVRIFWKKLNVEAEPKKSEELAEDKSAEESEEESGNRETVENDSVQEETVCEESLHDKSEEESMKQEELSAKTEKKKKKGLLEKIKYTFQTICDKIKVLIRKKEELQAFLADELHQLAWKRLKRETWRLLQFLKPKKLVLNLHFGFEDPAVTGKVLAGLSMLYPLYTDYVNIEPEFDEKILEGDACIKGNIRGIHLLIVICNLFFDKNIKATYKEIKKWKR